MRHNLDFIVSDRLRKDGSVFNENFDKSLINGWILEMIYKYLKAEETTLSRTDFGLITTGDDRLIKRLESGKSITSQSIDKIVKFIFSFAPAEFVYEKDRDKTNICKPSKYHDQRVAVFKAAKKAKKRAA